MPSTIKAITFEKNNNNDSLCFFFFPTFYIELVVFELFRAYGIDKQNKSLMTLIELPRKQSRNVDVTVT